MPERLTKELIDPKLTVVIPTFNEEASLSSNLDLWLQHCEAADWELVLVDDGSTDDTVDELRHRSDHPRLRAIRHRVNRGYGAALKTGLHQVSTPFVATMDADGQHSMDEVSKLFAEMVSRRVDMVIGARDAAATKDRYRRVGKALIRRLTRLLFGTDLRDLNSGLKVYRTEVVRKLLPFCPDSMAFSDIIALLHLNTNCEIRELSVATHSRTSGESTINTMTAVDTVLEIINIVMWFRPLRILLPVALVVFIIGAGWSVPFLLAGRGLSSVALLLMLSGFQMGVLALLAEQLSQIRRLDLPDVGYVEIGREQSQAEPGP